jgi:hypothetical protein
VVNPVFQWFADIGKPSPVVVRYWHISFRGRLILISITDILCGVHNNLSSVGLSGCLIDSVRLLTCPVSIVDEVCNQLVLEYCSGAQFPIVLVDAHLL